MKQTRKGQPWYFGMQVHVGMETRGVVHSLTTTDAAQHDLTQLPHLLHGQESTLYGDKAYDKAEDTLQWELSGGRDRVNTSGKRSARGDAINATRSTRRDQRDAINATRSTRRDQRDALARTGPR